MIIEIADEVFARANSRVNSLELYQLFRLAEQGRHILLIRPTWSDAHLANKWLDIHEDLRELFVLVLEDSIDRYSQSSIAAVRIQVHGTEGDKWTDVPSLSLSTACRLAELPLKILVEDRHTERAFLRMVTPRQLRRRFETAEKRGWLEFLHGGGLPSMIKYINDVTHSRCARHRLYVMFDSDARAPFDAKSGQTTYDRDGAVWGPSSDSRELAEVCAAFDIVYWQLARRAIENYLPEETLKTWATRAPLRRRKGSPQPTPSVFESNRTRVAALFALTSNQRFFFNMKKGLGGDMRSEEGFGRGESPLYRDVSKETREVLRMGFPDCASLLHDDEVQIKEDWLRDGQREELVPVIENILRRI